MQIAFTKMHGSGNEILVVDERRFNRPPPEEDAIRRLGDARTGPGFDQMMWLSPARSASADASYRVFNADGSEVEQCGNGARCVAWLIARERGGEALLFDSPAGPVAARVADGGEVSVDMGAPDFDPEKVPFVAESRADIYEIDVDGRRVQAAVLALGNPHCVLTVGDPATADVDTLGPALERHPRFPARCNVGFMAVRDRGRIDLRVYERGVGETRACGTGACAAMVAARLAGSVDDTVAVSLPGGQLVIKWRGPGASVWLSGEADIMSEGTIEL